MFQGINKFFDDLMKDLDKFCDGNSLCVFLIIMVLGFLVCKYFNVSGFSSGDNNFFPLINTIAKTGKPIIMSTGLMNSSEVKKSTRFIKKIWKNIE